MNKTDIARPTKTVTTALSARSRARRRELQGAVLLEAVACTASRRNDLIPDMKLETRLIASLRAPKRNVRRRDDHHVAGIARSIGELGLASPVLITEDGEIIDKVNTVEAAKTLGLTHVPCIVVPNLSPEQVRLLRIALNRLGEKGSWDLDALKLEFEELIELEMPVIVSGFTLPEIDIITMEDEPAIDAAANDCPAPESEHPAVTRLGDVWILGRHRLLCGDACKPESYAVLFGDRSLARAMFSDPPYNLRLNGFAVGSGNIQHREFVAASGEMSSAEFVTFLADFMIAASAHLMDGAILFLCMDWRHLEHVHLAARSANLAVENIVVWSKGSGGLGGLYRSAHEFVFVLKKGAGPTLNNVALGKHGRDRTNVWCYPGANQRGSSANAELANHPTPKPVELVADALLDVTHRDDVIVDPFMGSGTSIIAAEKTGRTAYGLELDPIYVDLIVRRFQTFTGIDATLATTGETFADVEAQRMAAEATSAVVPVASGAEVDAKITVRRDGAQDPRDAVADEPGFDPSCTVGRVPDNDNVEPGTGRDGGVSTGLVSTAMPAPTNDAGQSERRHADGAQPALDASPPVPANDIDQLEFQLVDVAAGTYASAAADDTANDAGVPVDAPVVNPIPANDDGECDTDRTRIESFNACTPVVVTGPAHA